MSQIDQDVCIYINHENIDLLLQGTSKFTYKFSSSEEAVAQTVCILDSIPCVDRDCKDCGVTKLTDNLFDDDVNTDSPVNYYQWQKVDEVMKKNPVEAT